MFDLKSITTIWGNKGEIELMNMSHIKDACNFFF